MSTFYQYHHQENDTLGVLEALKQCKEQGLAGIVFEKGEYHFREEDGAVEFCAISNHGNIGDKRVVFNLKDMEHFTVDGQGSTFYFHGEMLPVLISGSDDITLKNFTVICPNVAYPQGEVIASTAEYFDLRMLDKSPWTVSEGVLCSVTSKGNPSVAYNFNMFEKETKKVVRGTGDFWTDSYKAEKLNDTDVRIFSDINPPLTSILVFMAIPRVSAGVHMRNSSNIVAKDVIIHSCYGMGFIAQVCENITYDHIQVIPEEDSWLSSNADATHFVNCSGKVAVINSNFSNHLDDALNIHGVYLKVIESGAGWAVVRVMHVEQAGIQVCFPGDVLSAVDPKLLLEEGIHVTVDKVEQLGINDTKFFFKEDIEVPVGYDLENLSRQAELYMANCTVKSNRARGMLLATKGKTVIENNYFNSTGCAILFECDGSYWYEAGSVEDVLIQNNVFDDCSYTKWGNEVIAVAAREAEEEGRYYHNRIAIINNRIIPHGKYILYANNVREVIVQGNTVEDENCPYVLLHHVETYDGQGDIPYTGI